MANALAPVQNALASIYRAAVPVNARTLLETAAGNVSPITEADFSEEELQVLRSMYESKKAQNESERQTLANKLSLTEDEYSKAPVVELRSIPTPQGKAYAPAPVPYAEYMARLVDQVQSYDRTREKTSLSYNNYPDRKAAPTFDSWLESVWKSYTDPAYRVKTVLGSFNVQDAGQRAYIEDAYKFDAKDYYTTFHKADFDKDSVIDLWRKSNGPVDFLDMLMIRKQAPSRPVRIQLK